MNFIKYNLIKEKLRNRTLTEKESLPYLIVNMAIISSFYLIPNSQEYNIWDWCGGIFSVILSIIAVFYSYIQNGGKDGYDLIKKFIVLGLIVSIRCTLIFIPIIVFLYVIGDSFGIIKDETSIYETLIFGLYELILYYRIGKHISETNIKISQD